MSAAPRPEVSVITANYNGARHLAAAVRSVLDQTLASLELIIVDDASRDDSLAEIAAAAQGDTRVRVLVQPRNLGPGAARNRALEAARGRWIAIFDSDDLMAPERLEQLLACARREGVQLVADNLLEFSDVGEFAPRVFLRGEAWASPRRVDLAAFVASNRMYARQPSLGYLKPVIAAEVLAASGARYDERLKIGEDYEFLAGLLAGGRELVVDPAPLYRYRKHPGSISHRLGGGHLEALLAAQSEFEAQHGPFAPAVEVALERRARSLRRALRYEAVIADLKSGRLASALRRSVKDPSIWPLLTMPLSARLGRATRALRSGGAKPPARALLAQPEIARGSASPDG